MPSGNSAGILGGCRIYQVWKIKRDNTEFLKYTKKYIDCLFRELLSCNISRVALSLWYSVKMSLAHTFPSVGIFLSINNICV